MAQAIDELRSFAKCTGMPSVSTLKGLGAVDPKDPNYMGHVGDARDKSIKLGSARM